MAEPPLVADCVKAMCDAVALPVTVKHRIGIDRVESYDFVRDFVGTVAQAGCNVFIVHARNAWLSGLSPRTRGAPGPSSATDLSAAAGPVRGLSPKENRQVPPLRHELVYRLKRDFPALQVVLNGGVAGGEQIRSHLHHVDGVMLGREVYHHPWTMAHWDSQFLVAEAASAAPEREQVEQAMVRYMERLVEQGQPWSHASRHMLGLWSGTPGARKWRQVWSDHRLKDLPPAQVALQASQARLRESHADAVPS
jgi:tRNA-dihydrouridine synthase A